MVKQKTVKENVTNDNFILQDRDVISVSGKTVLEVLCVARGQTQRVILKRKP